MSGTFNVSRDLWDDTAFRDEPFTEREAWLWLIAEASWKPRTRRVANTIVDLNRGQLAASVRFLASAWKWSAPRVQRFLKRVSDLKMIDVKSDTGVSVITICNYDKYQPGGKAPDTEAIQHRYSADTNEKKGERRGKEGNISTPDGVDAVSPSPIPTDEVAEAVSAYNSAAQRAGWAQVQKITSARRSALRGRLADAGGIEGWRVALKKAEASDFLSGRVNPARGSPFRLTFDFITRQSSFIKLMEGNYDNRTGHDRPQQPRSGGHGSATVDAFAEVARRRAAGRG